MRKIKIITIALVLLFSNFYHAGEPPFYGCAALGCIGKIDRIYLNPNGSIQIPPPGTNTEVLNCTLAGNTYFTLKPDHVHFKEMYSMLLAAHTSQQDIYLRTVANSSDCEIWYSVIY